MKYKDRNRIQIWKLALFPYSYKKTMYRRETDKRDILWNYLSKVLRYQHKNIRAAPSNIAYFNWKTILSLKNIKKKKIKLYNIQG